MKEQINKKYKELKKLNPKDPEFIRWKKQSDLWNWVYSALRMDGYMPTKGNVVKLLNGEMVENMPLMSFALASAWRDVYEDVLSCISMDSRLEGKMLGRWANILCGRSSNQSAVDLFRTNNNVVYEWDLIPISSKSINSKLSDMLRDYRINNLISTSPLDLLSEFFLEFNKLYAFGDKTFQVSMSVLMFGILSLGYPLPEITLSDVEFNSIMADYIHDRNIKPFRNILLNCIYNRLDTVVMAAKHISE